MPLTSTIEISTRPQLPFKMADADREASLDFVMAPRKIARFPRSSRLLRHADFERVYKQGRRHFSASMTVFYWPRPALQTREAGADESSRQISGLRIGFTVGRVLGGAVQRNRMKRRLREAVRMTRPASGVSADVVINPKKSLLTVDFSVVVNEVSRAFVVIEQKLGGKLSPEASGRIVGSPQPRAGRRS